MLPAKNRGGGERLDPARRAFRVNCIFEDFIFNTKYLIFFTLQARLKEPERHATGEAWAAAVRQARRFEDTCWQTDNIQESTVEPVARWTVVITAADEEEEDDDAEFLFEGDE